MKMARFSLFGLAVVAALAFACSRDPVQIETSDASFTTVRWHGVAESDSWNEAADEALNTHAAILLKSVPTDIATYCPAYPNRTEEMRKAFWLNLIASLSYHESTWRPDAVGGDGRWYGLLQILPATARGYGCVAQDTEALKNGALNVSCALRIMAVTVPRDGVVSENMQGVAADWGPFHQSRKREDIEAYTRSLPLCRL